MIPFKFLTNHIDDELLDPSLPSFYDIPPIFDCVGVTPYEYNPHTYLPYRYLVYENVITGRMVTGELIEYGHPMWDYNRQINPEFYNRHYIDRR